MLQKFGKDVVDDLESREYESKKWTIEELNAIRSYYNKKLKELRAGIITEAVPVDMLTMFEDLQ